MSVRGGGGATQQNLQHNACTGRRICCCLNLHAVLTASFRRALPRAGLHPPPRGRMGLVTTPRACIFPSTLLQAGPHNLTWRPTPLRLPLGESWPASCRALLQPPTRGGVRGRAPHSNCLCARAWWATHPRPLPLPPGLEASPPLPPYPLPPRTRTSVAGSSCQCRHSRLATHPPRVARHCRRRCPYPGRASYTPPLSSPPTRARTEGRHRQPRHPPADDCQRGRHLRIGRSPTWSHSPSTSTPLPPTPGHLPTTAPPPPPTTGWQPGH